MDTQTYATHRHNPKMTGIGFLFVLIAIVALALRYFYVGGRTTFAAGLAAMIAAEIVLLLISRTYTTKLQDRIIRVEMQVRTAQVAPPQRAALSRLSMPQLVALRFASDQELPALIERAEREHLTADQIKREIKTWVPDLDRT
jgi:predicted phage-related endonuclease